MKFTVLGSGSTGNAVLIVAGEVFAVAFEPRLAATAAHENVGLGAIGEVAVLLELGVRQPRGVLPVGILDEEAKPRLYEALDVPSTDLGLSLGLGRGHAGPGQDRERRNEESSRSGLSHWPPPSV